jgi:hypothetical protein
MNVMELVDNLHVCTSGDEFDDKITKICWKTQLEDIVHTQTGADWLNFGGIFFQGAPKKNVIK